MKPKKWFVYMETGEVVEAATVRDALREFRRMYPRLSFTTENVQLDAWALRA